MLGGLFSNGKVEIRLTKHTFVPGERIEGTVAYALDEPKEGKRLVVGLRATQRVRTSSVHQGRVTSSDETRTIYEFKNELAGEATYTHGSKSFELTVPPDALDRVGVAPEGLLGDIARAASFLAGNSKGPVEWEIFAFVDLPWKVNPKKSQPITVVEGAPPAAGPPRIRIG